ncbi:hypothetical protein [Streptomyces sp. SAS_281]|uniref:hypothetical protein n=1 Tax=Streptomyces sp. SAS_281 TaxID=3412744 RepID=UPI00403D3BD3
MSLFDRAGRARPAMADKLRRAVGPCFPVGARAPPPATASDCGGEVYLRGLLLDEPQMLIASWTGACPPLSPRHARPRTNVTKHYQCCDRRILNTPREDGNEAGWTLPGPGMVRRHRSGDYVGTFGPGVIRVPGLLRSERSDTMAWVVGTGALLGLLAIAAGIVTLRTGWIVPIAQRHVTRQQLHGLGALLTGTSVVLQSLFYFRVLPNISWEARFLGGNALLFSGLVLIALSQLLSLRRGHDHHGTTGV